ncbi:MAG: hypothetical protein WC705_00040 [Candidatus Paceibacterota bacterium]|jgi:ABC-type sugar transport system permease subunit
MNTREKNKKDLFRWIILLPAALVSGFLVTFPLHWMLYLIFTYNGTFLGFIELPPETYKSVEYLLSPFVIALFFVLVGSKIAPTHKFITAIILSVLYIIFCISFIVLGTMNGIEMFFGLRSLGPIFGLLLGLYIVCHKSKENLHT